MRLFDDRPRTDARPMRRGESHFAFLDRVHTPYWARVRDLLNSWVTHYPADARPDLTRRLRSKSESQHWPAFWELYLHEALRRDGWDVVVHPEVPGTSARLDFLASRRNETLLVEATTIVRPLLTEQQQLRLATVLNAVERIDTYGFSLGLDYLSVEPGAPGTRALLRELSAWLASLDRAAVLERATSTAGLADCPTYPWMPAPGWHLIFRAFPREVGVSAGPGFHAIGMTGPGGAFPVDHRGPLLAKLDEKLERVDALSPPYIIAVLDLSEYPLYPHECDTALYGHTESVYDPSTRHTVGDRRVDDGFWSAERSKASSVSAVLVCSRLRPWSFCGREGATPILWLGPTSGDRVPQLPWPTYALSPDRVSIETVAEGRPMHELFGVSYDWPGPGPPFPR